MDDGPLASGAPPPRHELESEDEDVPVDIVQPIQMVGTVPHGRAWSLLLDDTGAAILLATQGDWAEHAHLVSGDRKLAAIHVPASDEMPIVMLVPASQAVPLPLQQAMAQSIAQCRPQSVVVIQPYNPRMVLSMPGTTDDEALDPLVRYLQHTPPAQPVPSTWAAMADAPCQPWSAPHTLTGCGAAFFSQAMYAGCPALLLSVPSARPRAHPHYYASNESLYRPQGMALAVSELREQLVRLVEPLEDRFEALLVRMVGSGASQGAGPSLLVHAWQVTVASRAATGPIGDGGMYI